MEQEYATFMTQVNRQIQILTSLDSSDLPDWDWKESFSADYTAEEAVDEFLEELYESANI